MNNKLFFSLAAIAPHTSNSAGNLTCVTSKEVPGFVNISFAHLSLNNRGSLEPIWHPNAHKIGYCVEGQVLVVMRTPSGAENFTVKKGEIFFIPQGFVHHIENIDAAQSVINFALSSSNPQTMYLSQAIYSLSENVFTSTFNSPAHFIDGLPKSKNNQLLKTLPALKKPPQNAPNGYKFDIEDSPKVISSKGGYLQLGIKSSLPTLQGLGILGFGLTPKGCVEPHWHTNAGELVFIVKGKTRITVLAPDGHVDVLEVNAGEGAFAPASHFHNIENMGNDEVQVIAFFNHGEPDYLGIGEVIGAYSNELLASVFNTPPDYFEALKKPEKPLVIVPV